MNRAAVSVLAALILLGGAFVGCAPIQKDAGYRDVQSEIRARSGFQAYWDQQPPGQGPVDARIQALLHEELTDRNAVEIALLNNRGLQATFEELGIARADLIEAGLIRNPLLFAEVRFPFRPIELSLMQSILELLTLRRRKDLGASVFEAAKLRVGTEVLAVIAEARLAFYHVQSVEQALELRTTILEASRTAAELAIRQRGVGNISDLDLENTQVLFEQAKLDLAQVESEVQQDRERLNDIMGVWGKDTDWKTPAKLPDLPVEEDNLEALESLAVLQRLDLAGARQEVEVASKALPLARAGAVGEVAVGVHHGREPDGTRTTGPAVEVPLPLFNRGRAARMRAEAVLRQAQHRYAALAVRIRAEVRAARIRLLAARSRAEYFRDVILPRRARIIDLSQRQYNFMLIGSFQLLLAKQSEIAAENDSLEALRDYWIARVELERAAGGSLRPLQAGDAAPHAANPWPRE